MSGNCCLLVQLRDTEQMHVWMCDCVCTGEMEMLVCIYVCVFTCVYDMCFGVCAFMSERDSLLMSKPIALWKRGRQMI